ncbi:MAG: L-aspartate oxidase [Thermodesulfobacteriota bacterium]
MKNDISDLKCDFLIIGSGLAGLYAAFYASQFGSCILITKQTLNQSNSYWAQGGIAAAVDPGDSPFSHKEDTINAGRRLCNEKAVDILVEEGRERVIDLISLGMEFDSNEEGLLLGLEGGHSQRRVLHAGGNSTGKKMVEFLLASVLNNPQINIMELTTITNIISDGATCFGAWGYKQGEDKYVRINSGITILATGGASAIFKRTTNPEGATGEGISLAYNAGAEISDMEFIQFHPTAFYTHEGETFLITEAVRGEGAHLVNINGKRFMKDYHSKEELAPRDVVSKAIHNETKNSGRTHVYLSLAHLDKRFVRDRFSNIYTLCLKYGFDLTSDLIPVAPAAHYTIGGVKTGIMGETNIKGFYACGEVSNTGVHGANRLASNSLLECIVFAKRAVDGAKDSFISTESSFPTDYEGHNLSENKSGDEEIFNILKKEIMENTSAGLGIIRTGGELEKFKNLLGELEKDASRTRGWFNFKLGTMIEVCSLIVNAAYLRKESRGAHQREDFPEEKGDLIHHIIFKKGSEPYESDIN